MVVTHKNLEGNIFLVVNFCLINMTSKKDMCKVLLMACAIAIVNRSNANDGEYEYEFEHTEPHNSPHKPDVGLYPGN